MHRDCPVAPASAEGISGVSRLGNRRSFLNPAAPSPAGDTLEYARYNHLDHLAATPEPPNAPGEAGRGDGEGADRADMRVGDLDGEPHDRNEDTSGATLEGGDREFEGVLGGLTIPPFRSLPPGGEVGEIGNQMQQLATTERELRLNTSHQGLLLRAAIGLEAGILNATCGDWQGANCGGFRMMKPRRRISHTESGKGI